MKRLIVLTGLISLMINTICSQDRLDERSLNVKISYHPDRYSNETYKKVNKNYLGDTISLICKYGSEKVVQSSYNMKYLNNGFECSSTIISDTSFVLFPDKFDRIKSPKDIHHDFLVTVDFNWIILQSGDTVYYPNISGRPKISDIITDGDYKKLSDPDNGIPFNRTLKKSMNEECADYFKEMEKNYYGLVYFFKKW